MKEFEDACYEGDYDFVVEHIEENNENVNLGLMYSIYQKNMKLFKFLLNHENINPAANNYQALVYTSGNDYKEFHRLIVDKLKEKGLLIKFIKNCKRNGTNYKDYV